MRTSKIVLMGFFLLSLAGSATARQNQRPGQNQRPDQNQRLEQSQQIQKWLQGQNEALSTYSHYEVQASVHHVVRSGSGTREASVKMLFSGDPLRPHDQPEVLEFVLNGDSLDTSGRRRVQQGLTSLMSPEIGPLLYGFLPPVLAFKRMRLIGGPNVETIQGESMIRYTFLGGNEGGPPSGPGLRGGQRPPVGSPPNARTPIGNPRPGGVRRPPIDRQDGGRPGFNPPGRPGGEPPLERVSLWFDESGERLVMSSTELVLPGERKLVVETSFERMGGVDLPTWRTIKGSFSMQRRLRMVTARLEHETMYSNYSFTKN